MSGQVPRDEQRGLWFNLTIDATCDLARDTDRVGALVTVQAQPGEHGAAAAADPAIDVAGLRADFTRLMEHARRLLVPEPYLRLTLDPRFRLEAVRQIRPTENDLTGHRTPREGGVVDIPLLAWGEETRDYLVVLRVDPGALPYDDEVRAARVAVVAAHLGARGGARGGASALVPCAAAAAVTVRRQSYRDSGPANVTVTQAEDLMRLGPPPTGRDLAGPAPPGEDGPPAGRGPLAAERLVRRVCPRGHITVAPVVRYCEEQGCDHEFTGDPDRGLPLV